MDKLTLFDLGIIIPLLEKELDQIHDNIESDDDDISNDASELSVPYGNTSSKLKSIYESMVVRRFQLSILRRVVREEIIQGT